MAAQECGHVEVTQRIELCAELRLGGLTPGEDLMPRVRELVRVPVFAMIRPRAGDFVYSPEEIAHPCSALEAN